MELEPLEVIQRFQRVLELWKVETLLKFGGEINWKSFDLRSTLNVAGKRSCFGEQLARQEIFLFLVSLLQNFDFKPPEGQDSIDVHEVWGVTVVPSAYRVRMVARDDA